MVLPVRKLESMVMQVEKEGRRRTDKYREEQKAKKLKENGGLSEVRTRAPMEKRGRDEENFHHE